MALVQFQATKNDAGRTLFKFLVKQLNNVPISKIEKMFRQKAIKVNGSRNCAKTYELQENDRITVYGISDYQVRSDIQTPITFTRVYEDEQILVVNKPANVPVHGTDDCLDFQVLAYLRHEQTDSFTPSHIGRLDKPTSGLMIYAKTYAALVQLNEKNQYFEKYYELKSDFPWENEEITCYAYYDNETKKVSITDRPSNHRMVTTFFVQDDKKYAQLHTGKKHQIRLTLQHLGYPVYGDKRYGGKPGKRLFLHCTKLVLHNLENELEYLNDASFYSPIKW